MFHDIRPISNEFNKDIQALIDGKTKPLGALGQLEQLAMHIARAQSEKLAASTIQISQPHLYVFAGDHGVASEGVSIAPSEVTGQMVANFAAGGAAINIFCRQFGWHFNVVDCGVLTEPSPELSVISQRLGDITQPLHLAEAMTDEQVNAGFACAKVLVEKTAQQGCNLIAFGEMGIGNTTAASAIMAALMQLNAEETVGRGTGVAEDIVLKKQQVVTQALALHHNRINTASGKDALAILACLGGFEIVQITGAMLAAAEKKMLIVVDGFIVTAAAMIAILINSSVKDYMIFAHCSGEQGHQKMLEHLEVEPLLNLGLRLGEGTGAALALPLIQASAAFYNDMASFAQAEVDNVV